MNKLDKITSKGQSSFIFKSNIFKFNYLMKSSACRFDKMSNSIIRE